MPVGEAVVGVADGAGVGGVVGAEEVGASLGSGVGGTVGAAVGSGRGLRVGSSVGAYEGVNDGRGVGMNLPMTGSEFSRARKRWTPAQTMGRSTARPLVSSLGLA